MQLPKILYNKSVRYILVILVILVLTEVTSYYIILAFSKRGIWIKDAPYHPYLGYIPRSNITMRFGGHCPYRELLNYGYIKTNAEGRSVTPLAYDNPDIIIAITGGGPVFGAVSSSNEKTVPSQLERIINEETRIKAEVINLGVPGYQSFQEMLSTTHTSRRASGSQSFTKTTSPLSCLPHLRKRSRGSLDWAQAGDHSASSRST